MALLGDSRIANADYPYDDLPAGAASLPSRIRRLFSRLLNALAPIGYEDAHYGEPLAPLYERAALR